MYKQKKDEGDDDIDRTDLKVIKEGKSWLKRFESANIKVNSIVKPHLVNLVNTI